MEELGELPSWDIVPSGEHMIQVCIMVKMDRVATFIYRSVGWFCSGGQGGQGKTGLSQ